MKQKTKKNQLTNDSIISGFRAQDNKILRKIYSVYFPMIRSAIFLNSGELEDAEDVFQDAMLVIINKVKSPGFKLGSSFGTFLYSICRHLWLRTLTKRKHNPFVFRDGKEIEKFTIPDTQAEVLEWEQLENQKYLLVQKHFKKLTNSNRNFLKSSLDISNPELAKKYNLTLKSTKTRKYICREKLKKSLAADETFKKILCY